MSTSHRRRRRRPSRADCQSGPPADRQSGLPADRPLLPTERRGQWPTTADRPPTAAGRRPTVATG